MLGVRAVPTAPRVVNAAAPIRICDNGGWTDTWFAGHGNVFNIAVRPGVGVQGRVHAIGALRGRVVLNAHDYGDSYAFAPGELPGRHPLLEAAGVDIRLPDDAAI